MQTHIESLIMETDGLDQESAKAEAKRQAERGGLTDETELGLYMWACVSAELEAGHGASKNEIEALLGLLIGVFNAKKFMILR